MLCCFLESNKKLINTRCRSYICGFNTVGYTHTFILDKLKIIYEPFACYKTRFVNENGLQFHGAINHNFSASYFLTSKPPLYRAFLPWELHKIDLLNLCKYFSYRRHSYLPLPSTTHFEASSHNRVSDFTTLCLWASAFLHPTTSFLDASEPLCLLAFAFPYPCANVLLCHCLFSTFLLQPA